VQRGEVMCKYKLLHTGLYKPAERIFRVEIEGFTGSNGNISRTCCFYAEEQFKKVMDEVLLLRTYLMRHNAMKLFDYETTNLTIPQCHTLKSIDMECIDSDSKRYKVVLYNNREEIL
jgi:hypothetical protein